jgi:hypothetical protein
MTDEQRLQRAKLIHSVLLARKNACCCSGIVWRRCQAHWRGFGNVASRLHSGPRARIAAPVASSSVQPMRFSGEVHESLRAQCPAPWRRPTSEISFAEFIRRFIRRSEDRRGKIPKATVSTALRGLPWPQLAENEASQVETGSRC